MFRRSSLGLAILASTLISGTPALSADSTAETSAPAAAPAKKPSILDMSSPSILKRKPVVIAVRKVKDRASAEWFRPSYEQKLADIMATELSNSGNFIVVGRQDEDLAELQAELNMSGINKKTAVKKDNLTQANYIVIATLSDFNEAGSKGGGGGFGFGGFSLGGKKQTKEFYVAFDVKVFNTSTGTIAYSRSIEGRAKEEKKGRAFSGSYGGFSANRAEESEIKLPVTRALRAAMIETAQYLDCILYRKDECVAEYEAKDEKRKESTKDTLDLL